jgi:PAS domain S-box-containing protein
MNVKRNFYIPMLALAMGGAAVVFVSCILLYARQLPFSSFVIGGIAVTVSVFAICVMIAKIITATIKPKLDKMKNEISEAEERTHLMLNTSPFGVNMIDENFMVVDCNNEALKMFGFTNKQEYMASFHSLSPEHQPGGELSSELSRKYLLKAFEEGYHRFEWEHQKTDGTPLPCDVTVVRSVYNYRTAIIAHMHDLRDIKSAISDIRQADEYTQLILNAMPMCCTLWDKELNLINCNREALRLFGVSDAQEFNKRFYDLAPMFQPNGEKSSEAGAVILKKAFTDGYLRTEWTHQLFSGELMPCEITLVRVKHKDDVYLAGYTRDLREQKVYIAELNKAQDGMRKARDIALAANQAKSIFLARMSHEIRTPMNSIIGFTELARDGDIPDETKEYLNNIYESAEWLLQIINDILDISKIESGKMELESIPFDLHDIFGSCKSAIMPKTEEKGISLYCYAEPSIGKKMLGDPVRLRQALTNLLSNAVKFTNVGTVKLLASIKGSDDKSVNVYFEVKDSGIGMTPEQIENIYEPFTQADDSITRKYGGTGLGLAITKNIIEMMGGKLTVESVLGVGTKFGFELTFKVITEDVDMPKDRVVFYDLEKPNFKGEILVCEDNIMNQKVMSQHLEKMGLKTVIAENGQVGIDIIKKRLQDGQPMFNLILMDIHMPVMDGLETAARIIDLGVRTPIVAVTANIMSNDIELYRESGILDFIGKPFSSQELWRCLFKYLTPVSFSPINSREEAADNDKLQRYLKLTFIKDNQNKYTEIIAAASSGNNSLAHRLTHTLKTCAAQIGETKLQQAAFLVEKMLAEGKDILTPEKNPGEAASAIESELKEVLLRLSPMINETASNVKKEPMDHEKINALFLDLKDKLTNRNPECINLLDDIRLVAGTEELVKHIEEYEFREALDKLTVLMREQVYKLME